MHLSTFIELDFRVLEFQVLEIYCIKIQNRFRALRKVASCGDWPMLAYKATTSGNVDNGEETVVATANARPVSPSLWVH